MTSEQGSAHTLDARTMTRQHVVDMLLARTQQAEPPPLRLVVRDRLHWDEILHACRSGSSGFELVGVSVVDASRPVVASDLDPGSAPAPRGSAGLGREVTVVDIRVPFWSMVGFMVKWAIASIPAALILAALLGVLAALCGGAAGGLLSGILASIAG